MYNHWMSKPIDLLRFHHIRKSCWFIGSSLLRDSWVKSNKDSWKWNTNFHSEVQSLPPRPPMQTWWSKELGTCLGIQNFHSWIRMEFCLMCWLNTHLVYFSPLLQMATHLTSFRPMGPSAVWGAKRCGVAGNTMNCWVKPYHPQNVDLRYKSEYGNIWIWFEYGAGQYMHI